MENDCYFKLMNDHGSDEIYSVNGRMEIKSESVEGIYLPIIASKSEFCSQTYSEYLDFILIIILFFRAQTDDHIIGHNFFFQRSFADQFSKQFFFSCSYSFINQKLVHFIKLKHKSWISRLTKDNKWSKLLKLSDLSKPFIFVISHEYSVSCYNPPYLSWIILPQNFMFRYLRSQSTGITPIL